MNPLHKIDTAAGESAARERASALGLARDSYVAPAPSSVRSAGVNGGTLLAHTVLLSGVAGYVDAAGFLSLFGFFPAHLTGELVGDAVAISTGHLGAHAARLWMFPIFMLSVVLAALVARMLRRRGQGELSGLLALLSASLLLFAACDGFARLFHEAHLPLALTGGFAVAAMGFQTALIRVSLSGSCPTTVMTGNLAQVVVDVVDHVFSRSVQPSSKREAQRARLLSVCGALAAFVSCAALGGWLTRGFGTLSVVLPALVTAGLTIRAWLAECEARTIANRAPSSTPWFTYDELWPEAADEEPWLDATDDEFFAPLHESESVTRLRAEPTLESRAARPAAPPKQARHASGTRLALKLPPID